MVGRQSLAHRPCHFNQRIGHNMWKTFLNGETLDVGEVQALIDQGVLPYATAAARDAELLTPTKGMLSILTTPELLEWYDGNDWTQLPELAALQQAINTHTGQIGTLGNTVDGLLQAIADLPQVKAGSLINVTVPSSGLVAVGVAPAFTGAGVPVFTWALAEPGTVGLQAHVIVQSISSQSNNGFVLDVQRADGSNPSGEVVSIYWTGVKP